MPRDRLVPLEGALNFRDVGGYIGRGGQTVKWGHVFRSDALHELTPADLEIVRGLGVRAIYDLRNSAERARQPTVIPGDEVTEIVHLTVGDDPDGNQRETLELIMSGELTEADDQFMADLYAAMLLKGATTFGSLLTALSDAARLPALFHCAAGKDRTGVAAALLLSVLGVDEGVILDDYELSTVYRSNKRIDVLRPSIEAAGVDVEKVRPFLSARRPVLEATLRHLRSDYGGIEAYLTGPAGVAPATLDTLRALLLD
ncbi:MAG TPA: tyrosine-protein phosphatase [Acidimicrobiales bacterium]|nr:tyrosine-protein phosphatase [Acidimicrobiales bacterium]